MSLEFLLSFDHLLLELLQIIVISRAVSSVIRLGIRRVARRAEILRLQNPLGSSLRSREVVRSESAGVNTGAIYVFRGGDNRFAAEEREWKDD